MPVVKVAGHNWVSVCVFCCGYCKIQSKWRDRDGVGVYMDNVKKFKMWRRIRHNLRELHTDVISPTDNEKGEDLKRRGMHGGD